MTRLSKNFTLEELRESATAKQTGIINAPGVDEVCAMCALVHNVLQPLRDAMGEPIKIGSGYRCHQLNKVVGGVSNSQHIKGEAADLCIDGDKEKGRKWFEWIKKHCEFDQLIWEKNPKTGNCWVHVSYVYPDFGPNRHKVIDGLEKK